MNTRAVSNTIGTVLLVAVVIALVTLVTFFVFNISDNGTNNQPTAMNTKLDSGPSDQSTLRLLDDSNPKYIAIRSPLGTTYNITSGVGETQNILSVTGEGDASVLAGSDQDSATVIKQYEIETGIAADIIVDKLKRGEQGVDWDYAKIQHGVDNATSGDTIVVRRADYDENVDVNKDVTIIAEPDTVIQDLNPERAVFDITGDNASVRNFEIDADPRPSDGHYSENGFYISGNDVLVKNNKIINATQIANSASVNVTGESARIVGNTFDKSNNGITSNDHSETHIVRRNNMLGLNNFDIKNLDSKGLNARSNYWDGGENVYGVVDTTRELGAPVSPPVDGGATKGIGGNGRVVYNNGRMFVLNGAGATDLYKLSITLEIGDGTVTIQPVSSNEFKVTSSTGNVDPDKVFNSTTLSQSDSVTESSSSDDGSTFNSGEALSFELNTSYNPPSSDGGTTSIDDSLGSTTVSSSGSSSSDGGDSSNSKNGGSETLFASETQTKSSSSGGNNDDSSTTSLDSINSVDTSPDWSVGLGETSRTVPINTEIEFSAPVTGLSSDKISSVDWKLGDGTTKNAAGQSVKHTYDETGSYSVLVTVTADDGKKVTSGMTVNVDDSLTAQDYDPIARIDISSGSVSAGESATFSASNSVDYDGNITSYEWDFDGDGSMEKTGETVSYTYSSVGSETVTLTVTDEDGLTGSTAKSVNVLSSSSTPNSSAPNCGNIQLTDSDNDGYKEVSNDHELQCMSNNLGASYELTQNIDASKTEQWNGQFDPISSSGDSNDQFTGRFNGNGYSIQGLHAYTSGAPAGLISYAHQATIENVRLENVDIDSSAQEGIGGVVGEGSESSVVIRNIYISGEIDGGSNSPVGGVIGTANFDNKIKRVRADVSVSGDRRAGGITGYMRPDVIIKNAYVTGRVEGDISGGIVGFTGAKYYEDGSIIDSMTTAKVYTSNPPAGGALGDIEYWTGTFDDVYWADVTNTDDADSDAVAGGASVDESSIYEIDDSGGEYTLSEVKGDSAKENLNLDFTNTWTTRDGAYPVPETP